MVLQRWPETTLPRSGRAARPGIARSRRAHAAVTSDEGRPFLFEGYCPACAAMVAAVESAPGVPNTPLACAVCGTALDLPIIVARRATPTI